MSAPGRNAVLRSVIAATLIGVLIGVWFALLNDSIEIFRNYVEGVWRYQVAVRSFAAPVVGIVIGGLAGANIKLALAPERVYGFIRGTLFGAIAGILLVLAQALLILVVILVPLQQFQVEYGALLTGFIGELAVAMLIGAGAGLLGGNRSLATPVTGATVGALIAAAFVLPIVVTVALTNPFSSLPTNSFPTWREWSFVSTNVIPYLPDLLAGTGSGAIICTMHGRRATDITDNASSAGVILGAVAAVTASSLSFHYVILGMETFASPISLGTYVFRAMVGLLTGCAIGMATVFVWQRVEPTRRADAGMISRD